MLESLCQGAGTIHELNLAGAFPQRAPYRPRERYEALKRTPLFDAERGQWNSAMSEAQLLEETERVTADQLLGVLVEAQFNPETALDRYKALQAAWYYDALCGLWAGDMSDLLLETNFFADAQLLGVLVEVQFNPEAARATYEWLKTTPFYDHGRGQWNWWVSDELRLQSALRHAAVQLLGVLVEAQFHPERAPELYAQLKATPLYDHNRGQWNDLMSEQQIVQLPFRPAVVQLLGVLVEAQFNPPAARALYEKLKATPLYDAEREQWNEEMSEEQEGCETLRLAYAQLLGVLVEAKLLSTLQRPLAEAVPPMPVTENW